MDLWKLTECWGRSFYYENNKRLKGRYKQMFWDKTLNIQTYGKGATFGVADPVAYQVVNDQWVQIKLVDDKALEEYLLKKEDTYMRQMALNKQKQEEWRLEAEKRHKEYLDRRLTSSGS